MNQASGCSKKCAFQSPRRQQKHTLFVPLSTPILGDSAQLLRYHMERKSRRGGNDEGSSVDSPSLQNIVCRPKSSIPVMRAATPTSKLYGTPKNPPLKPPDGVFGRSTPERARTASTSSLRSRETPLVQRHLATPDRRASSATRHSRLGSPLVRSGTPQQRANTPLLISGSKTSLQTQSKDSIPTRCSSAVLAKGTAVKNNSDCDNEDDDDEDILRLNFTYTREFRPHKVIRKMDGRQTAGDVQQSISSTSSSSMEDTVELIYKFRRRIKKMKNDTDFTKYIPIPIPVPLHVPKLFLNKMDPNEWKEAQEAYEKDRVANVKESGSETRLDETKDQVVPGTPNKTVKCIPMRCSGSAKSKKKLARNSAVNRDFQPLEEFYCNYVKPRQNIPRRMDSRYDLDKAQLLIQSNIKNNPSYSCVLYISLPQKPNFGLCHAMTELCVSAMLSFFHPYRDVQCLWIEDIQAKLVYLLKDHNLKPRFTRLVYLRKFEAILVLSEDASQLLRHKDMCFLHSITSSLKIQPHKLLVLCREGGNGDPAYNRPGTAEY